MADEEQVEDERALADVKAKSSSSEAHQPILSKDIPIQSIELIEGTMKVIYKDEDFWSDSGF